MAHLAAAVAAFHGLLESADYGDLSWAERLQHDMRAKGLTDSGRLVNPVLRPHFVTRQQIDRLGRISRSLAEAMARLEPIVLNSPALLNRLRLLPAEKALAALPCTTSSAAVATGITASIQNGSVSVRAIDMGAGTGFAYSDVLADMFLGLPIMRDLERLGFRPGKCGSVNPLLCCIVQAWHEFGGSANPNIAILELKQTGPGSEGELIAEKFRDIGIAAEVVNPEQLEFRNGKLRAGPLIINVVLRRIDTRDLLVRYELSHPLFQAYRARAVCVINDFRSELWHRRAALELLTDPAILPDCQTAQNGCLRDVVPWTRFVTPRKTTYRGETVDLVPFLLRNRERFVLAPNHVSDAGDVFTGVEMTDRDWDRALRSAVQRSYVAQEYFPKPADAFPVFRYNELALQKLSVTVLTSAFNGVLQGASATLESGTAGNGRKVAIAPVLALG